MAKPGAPIADAIMEIVAIAAGIIADAAIIARTIKESKDVAPCSSHARKMPGVIASLLDAAMPTSSAGKWVWAKLSMPTVADVI